MANGRVRDIHSHGHPRVYRRPSRSRPIPPRDTSFSKAEFLGYALSYVMNSVYSVFLKLCPEWLSSWFYWCPTSAQALEIEEQDVLSNLKRPYTGQLVNIGKCCGTEDNFIWTISLNQNAERTPLVLIHSFACGVGFWVMNLDSLASSRPVYALDLLGFGRSSRPEFSSDALEAEMQFFISLEKWRVAVGLDKFILLGHSMGGYIAASYALHYPERVALLILADPWGLPEKEITFLHHYEMDSWVKFLTSFLYGFNYLALVRAAGPCGPPSVRLFRKDLEKKYGHFVKNPEAVMNYVYHCNAQTPSGEAAFKAMTEPSGFARHPMMSRLSLLDWRVPITFVYGSRSWGNRQPGLQIKYSRLNSFVDVQVIDGAGYHVYADKPEQFNALINRVCESLENGLIQPRNF